MDLNLDPHYQISEHFQAKEFFCHDGTPITDMHLPVMDDLLEFLERLRFGINLKIPEAGDIGIRVVSGFRHPEYNKECGGAPNSGHLFEGAAAADVKFTDPHIPYGTLWQISIDVDKSFPTHPYRLGNYFESKGQKGWVHIGCDYGVGGTRWFK